MSARGIWWLVIVATAVTMANGIQAALRGWVLVSGAECVFLVGMWVSYWMYVEDGRVSREG